MFKLLRKKHAFTQFYYLKMRHINAVPGEAGSDEGPGAAGGVEPPPGGLQDPQEGAPQDQGRTRAGAGQTLQAASQNNFMMLLVFLYKRGD